MQKGRGYPQTLTRFKLIDCVENFFIPRQIYLFIWNPILGGQNGWRSASDIAEDQPGFLTEYFNFPNWPPENPVNTATVWIDGTNELLARGIYCSFDMGSGQHYLFFQPWDWTVNNFFDAWPTTVLSIGDPVNTSNGPLPEFPGPVVWSDYQQVPQWEPAEALERGRAPAIAKIPQIESAARAAAFREIARRKTLGHHTAT